MFLTLHLKKTGQKSKVRCLRLKFKKNRRGGRFGIRSSRGSVLSKANGKVGKKKG